MSDIYLTEEQVNNLLRRMAAHQLRMGELLVAIAGDNHYGQDEAMQKLGEHNQWLQRSIEESQ